MGYVKPITQTAVLLSFLSIFFVLISPIFPESILDYFLIVMGIVFSSVLLVTVVKFLRGFQ